MEEVEINPRTGLPYKRSKQEREKISKAMKKYDREHPEWRQQHSERIKKIAAERPEYREAKRRAAWKLHHDPELKAKQVAAMTKTLRTPEQREKNRQRGLAQWRDPEIVARTLEGFRRRYDEQRIREAKKAEDREYAKQNKEFDVNSKFYHKEREYLKGICKEIMSPYGIEPLDRKTYSYYLEIVEYFRPGWYDLDRKRRYGGIDPLADND